MRLTHEAIEAGRSLNGGWSKEQVMLLGVKWPLVPGWKNGLIGREVPDENYQRFLLLKDVHLGSRALDRAASKMLHGKQKRKCDSRITERAKQSVRLYSNGPTGTRFVTCKNTPCVYPYCTC